jgi:ribosomal protein S18 acetylase RimI-like enzyme
MEDLANVIWRSLAGSHRGLSVGSERTRRYSRDYPALFGFDDPNDPDFDSIAPHCETGDHLYCTEWSGPVPQGWRVDFDGTVCAMVWKGGAPPEVDLGVEIAQLADSHVDEMRALARTARPGPYAPRPLGLGDWLGIFEDGKLVAMAGERLKDGRLHELSGICTLPTHQGRGLARNVTAAMVRRQLERGEIPFLHVMPDNLRARRLYERMGFGLDREPALRVVSRVG